MTINNQNINNATQLAYAAADLIRHTNGEHDAEAKAVRALAVTLAKQATRQMEPAADSVAQ